MDPRVINTVTKARRSLLSVRCGNFNVIRNNHFANTDVFAARAGAGTPFYELSAEAQQAAMKEAAAIAQSAKSNFPNLSIDYERVLTRFRRRRRVSSGKL